MLAFVTSGPTDILRGLRRTADHVVAGFKLRFSETTLFQVRKPHDSMGDFESGIPYAFMRNASSIWFEPSFDPSNR